MVEQCIKPSAPQCAAWTILPTMGYLKLNLAVQSLKLSFSMGFRSSTLSLQSLRSVEFSANARATSLPAKGYIPAGQCSQCSRGITSSRTSHRGTRARSRPLILVRGVQAAHVQADSCRMASALLCRPAVCAGMHVGRCMRVGLAARAQPAAASPVGCGRLTIRSVEHLALGDVVHNSLRTPHRAQAGRKGGKNVHSCQASNSTAAGWYHFLLRYLPGSGTMRPNQPTMHASKLACR